MLPSISIVTLGVADMERARSFYAALGFVASSASNADITFFKSHGIVLGLYGRAALAEDAQVVDAQVEDRRLADGSAGFSGVSIAHNVGSEAAVGAALAEAVAAGATLKKPAQKVFWGGYSGYFADPDGHLWEVAYNPFFPLDAHGRVTLPD